MKKPLIKEVIDRVKEGIVTWQLKGFRTKN
jgi:hypothetical protein